MWFKRKEIDIETFNKRLISVENAIIKLNSEILGVTVDQKLIRDKVLRKIQFKKEPEEEEERLDPYKGVLVPESFK